MTNTSKAKKASRQRIYPERTPETEPADLALVAEEVVIEEVKPMPFIRVSPFETRLSAIPEGHYFQVGDEIYKVVSRDIGMNVVFVIPVPGGLVESTRYTMGFSSKCRSVEVTI